MRDVLRLYDTGSALMLTVEGPQYPNWDQDATAVRTGTPIRIRLTSRPSSCSAADFVAARFANVSGDQWQRTGFRSDGAHFTVETFARYFVHDPVHHLYDLTGARV